MNVLMSPVLWVFLAILYIFKGKAKAEGTDLSIFDAPKVTSDGTTTVITSSGQQIKGTTLTVSRANTIANLLFEEFDEYFSSESQILDLLKGLNEKDFILVFDQFGKHKQDILTKTGSLLLGKDYNLIEWINQEVTTGANRIKLNTQFPNIF